MMEVMYYFEIMSLDGRVYRAEILSRGEDVVSMGINPAASPLVIKYEGIERLDPVWGGGCSIRMESDIPMRFVDLHTDDPQVFQVRIYRDGVPFWLGWMDPELYEERLTDIAPYEVGFTAADLNVLDRIKYLDGTGARYTDIVTLTEHLRRCISALGLPFTNVYLGCSTAVDGMGSRDTVFGLRYVQSSNFYDEDDKPMSCREVIESILRPFGLMMVQRDASLYIFDMDTIVSGGRMKKLDTRTLSVLGDETIPPLLGDVGMMGLASMDSSYGFESLVNNVSIVSSLYGSPDIMTYAVEESALDDKVSETDGGTWSVATYKECPPWTSSAFRLFKNKQDDNTITGAYLGYFIDRLDKDTSFFDVRTYLPLSGPGFSLWIKLSAFVNTDPDGNPFADPLSDFARPRFMSLKCDLFMEDTDGRPVMYYTNMAGVRRWAEVPAGTEPPHGSFSLYYTEKDYDKSRIDMAWIVNSNISYTGSGIRYSFDKDIQQGCFVPLPTDRASGRLRLDVLGAAITGRDWKGGDWSVYPERMVQDILLNDLSVVIRDEDGNDVSEDDYKFDSYIDPKVETDMRDISLSCVTANEDGAPVGRANLLERTGRYYGIATRYSRKGATDILERLLMRTLHSNLSGRKERWKVVTMMAGNPVGRTVTYEGVLDGDYLVTGCEMDLWEATTVITAVGYSGDTIDLSNIPYE